jgi:hypothetical protein
VEVAVTGMVILGVLKTIEASGLRLVTVMLSRSFTWITGSTLTRALSNVVSWILLK